MGTQRPCLGTQRQHVEGAPSVGLDLPFTQGPVVFVERGAIAGAGGSSQRCGICRMGVPSLNTRFPRLSPAHSLLHRRSQIPGWSALPKGPRQVRRRRHGNPMGLRRSSSTSCRRASHAQALPGEEARYAQVLAVIEAAKRGPKLKAAMTRGRLTFTTRDLVSSRSSCMMAEADQRW